jgi:excinuclease UvrABC ATPase subunit
MVRHLGAALTEMVYIFDEPTIGLHPHDIERLNGVLRMLRDKGNTVLVVEHKPEVMAIADHIVDMGPGAGKEGGAVVFEGTFATLKKSGTKTGKHLAQHASLKMEYREAKGHLLVEKATLNNLRNVTVKIPKGVLTVVTGVAGSGKSSLIHGCARARCVGTYRSLGWHSLPERLPRSIRSVLLFDGTLESGVPMSTPDANEGIAVMHVRAK